MDEIRKLTVDDLGGTAHGGSYAPGTEVIDALEAFRMEETVHMHKSDPELTRSRLGQTGVGKGSAFAASRDGAGGDSNLELSSLKASSWRGGTPARRAPLWTKKLALVASFVAGVVLLYFGGGFAKAKIDEYFARKNAKPQVAVENRAIAILDANGPVNDALKAAVDAVNAADGPENRKILERARNEVEKQVGALLNAIPWNAGLLDKASVLVNDAQSIDLNSPAIKNLREQVSEEAVAYRMTIQSIDPAAGSVTLRITYQDKPPDLVLKKKDELVRGRFKVTRVGDKYVSFEDPVRKNKAGVARSFTLALDGSITVQ